MDIVIVRSMEPMSQIQMHVLDLKRGQVSRRWVVKVAGTNTQIKMLRERSYGHFYSRWLCFHPILLGSPADPLSFPCPQQPKLQLPLSRVSDGICDCCDGADEPGEGICEDICDQVLRAEREARAKLEKDFQIGHNKRKHEIFKFKQFRQEKLQEIEQLQAEKDALDPQAPAQQANDMIMAYAEKRIQTAKTVAENSDLWKGLTPSELRTFIILACQVTGELQTPNDGIGGTCSALRLAGLEVGMVWGGDDFQDPTTMEMENKSSDLKWARRLFSNTGYEEASWSLDDHGEGKKGGSKRRRLDEDREYEDDDLHDYRGYGDDDYLMDDYDVDETEDSASESSVGLLDELEGLQKELVENVRALYFSSSRNSFLKRSMEIASEISVTVSTSSSGENSDSTDDEQVGGGNDVVEGKGPPVDLMAHNMVKNSLQKTEAIIVKGFNAGASASLFLTANEGLAEEQLRFLATFVVYHGKLSAALVWQVLQGTVDELKTSSVQDNDQTCVSPWAGYCPPKTVNRNGVVIPSGLLMGSAEQFCKNQTGATMEACAADSSSGIPPSIPDGYYGYHIPVVAAADDPIHSIFSALTSLPFEKEEVEKLEDENSRLQGEIKSMQKKITDCWNEIGGKDGKNMGPNGELYSLSDQCYSVEAGKYTYEVCIFGDAKQKEGPSGGTNLGKFTRMDYNAETGERTLRWENGQKCWNGPNRSATVQVTCGAENKVLSADEPDTCRYVLEMESYIACDEDFRKRLEL